MATSDAASPIDYARELRAVLPAEVFAPARSRLLWLPVHLTIIVVATSAVASGVGGWWLAALLVPVIGLSFAALAMVGHEILHGAVIRGAWAIQVLGWLCFLPFVLSPRLWIGWHNKVHHQNTARDGVDPDAYPTLAAYRSNRVLRIVTRVFSFGRNSPLGLVSLVLGFTIQSLHMLVAARRSAALSPSRHRVAIAQTLLGVAIWTAVAFAVGPLAFVFVYVLPLLVANAIVMSYIFTNHGLSSLTEHNDPLLNTLSVTTPRWYGFLTLDFGLHVEHHLMPSVSGRHAWRVREVLQARWPERYQSMPFTRALGQLLRTARVYRTPTTLHDPWSGREWPTLGRAERELV